MAAQYTVQLTASFERKLEEIEAFLAEAEAPQAFDALLLYARIKGTVYLLSIRHHRQVSFDFQALWP